MPHVIDCGAGSGLTLTASVRDASTRAAPATSCRQLGNIFEAVVVVSGEGQVVNDIKSQEKLMAIELMASDSVNAPVTSALGDTRSHVVNGRVTLENATLHLRLIND